MGTLSPHPRVSLPPTGGSIFPISSHTWTYRLADTHAACQPQALLQPRLQTPSPPASSLYLLPLKPSNSLKSCLHALYTSSPSACSSTYSHNHPPQHHHHPPHMEFHSHQFIHSFHSFNNIPSTTFGGCQQEISVFKVTSTLTVAQSNGHSF